MPLQPENMMATGYIVCNRFVMIDPTNYASQPTAYNTTLGGLGGFHVIQACAGWGTLNQSSWTTSTTPGLIGTGYLGTTIGVSADGTNYPPINDPTVFPSGIIPSVLAAPGQWVKIFCQGSSDVLLQLGTGGASGPGGQACNPGDFLAPTSATTYAGNYTLSSGNLADLSAGCAIPLTLTSNTATAGINWYGARALQACTGAVGEKIRVEVIGGYFYFA